MPLQILQLRAAVQLRPVMPLRTGLPVRQPGQRRWLRLQDQSPNQIKHTASISPACFGAGREVAKAAQT
jgi:hypothetical protein